MVKLYHASQSRSVRPRLVLEEIGAPYELVRLDLEAGEQKRPEYLKLNPNGTVPTLVDSDVTLFESPAICQYLADKFPDKRLAPPVGTPARGLYYQWIHFATSTLEPPAVAVFLHAFRKPKAERIPVLAEEGRAQLGAAINVIEQALAGRPYILGDQYGVADIMLGTTLGWAQMMGLVGASGPNTAAYLARLMARPAYRRAIAD